MTFRNRSTWMGALVAALAMIISASPAESTPELTFDQGAAQSGGFLYYSGNAGDPIVGTAIQFFFITPNSEIPANNTVQLNCNSCYLDFQTGPVSSSNIINATTATYEANAGGELALEGTIAATNLGTGFGGYDGPIVFNGEFTSFPIKPFVIITSSTGGMTAFGKDEKACTEEQILQEACEPLPDPNNDFDSDLASLVEFYGLGALFNFTNLTTTGDLVILNPDSNHADWDAVLGGVPIDLSLLDDRTDSPIADGTTVVIGEGGFLVHVSTSDLTNRPVPAPGTGLLLVIGIGALAASRRKRGQK